MRLRWTATWRSSGAVLANDASAGFDAGAGYFFQSPGPVLVGDFNGDLVVDAADYTVWRNSSGQVGSNLPADGNGDGAVNRADYLLWKRNFGGAMANGSLVGGASVPEPAAIALAGIAFLCCATFRFRNR